MKHVCLVALSSLLLLTAIAAPEGSTGGTFDVLGPQIHRRASGAPQQVQQTFAVANPSARYFVTVQQVDDAAGTADLGEVTSAVVSVNGIVVLGQSDFKAKSGLLERAVTLRSTNTLTVEVRGKPGAAVRLRVYGIDDDQPRITATAAPAPNSTGWNRHNLTVSFTCSDTTSGIATCTAPVTVSGEGASQSVTGTAVDRAGNSATASASVSLDRTPPALVIASPLAGAIVQNRLVAVTGGVSDSVSGVSSLTCNGSPAQLTPGAFSCDVSLAEGPHTIQVQATDKAGNTATAVREVTVRTIPPGIGATAITPSSTAAGMGLLATVTAAIPDPALIQDSLVLQRLDGSGRVVADLGSLSDSGAAGDAAAGDRIFSRQVSVLETSPGPVTFRIAALFQGSASLVYSPPLTITVTGSTATDIAILSPAHLSFTNIPAATVSGSVADDKASVKVNGIQAQMTGRSFSVSVPLVEGTTNITAVALNSGGSVTSDSIQVTLDTHAPKLAVTSPVDGFSTTAESVTVTGVVNDIVIGTVNEEQAQVTVNEVPARVANRSFVASNVRLSDGDNTVRVRATDRLGNSVVTSLVVKRVAGGEPAIIALGGDNQSAVVGAAVGAPLRVKLVDATGQPVGNAPVVFKVTQNDGLVMAASEFAPSVIVTTANTGEAEAMFRVGSRAGAGNNRVEATAVGFAGTAVFVASGTTTAPALINMDSGGGQVGVVRQRLSLPFVAVVTDAGYNRLRGVPVTFKVAKGGGTFGASATTLTTNTDGDGRALAMLTLGAEDGIENNVVEATFPGNRGHAAAFTATGRLPGDPAKTSIRGVVLNNSGEPIVGATLRLFQLTEQGVSNNIPSQVVPAVTTNAEGQFLIAPAPVGWFKLMADGSTGQGGAWPTLEFDMWTIAGQENSLELPIYLPALDTVNKVCVSETEGGTLTLPQVPGFSLKIAAGSATFPGGSRSGCVTVTPVNGDKIPMSPGFGQQPRFVVTIQPAGTVFSPAAQITFPNVDGLAPRQVTELYSYDHDLASFVAIGTATVSADGSTVTSDAAGGIIKAGWHCGGSPNTTGSAGTCPQCQTCIGASCVPTTGTCSDGLFCTSADGVTPGPDACADGDCSGKPVRLQEGQSVTYQVSSDIDAIWSRVAGFGGNALLDVQPPNLVGQISMTETTACCEELQRLRTAWNPSGSVGIITGARISFPTVYQIPGIVEFRPFVGLDLHGTFTAGFKDPLGLCSDCPWSVGGQLQATVSGGIRLFTPISTDVLDVQGAVSGSGSLSKEKSCGTTEIKGCLGPIQLNVSVQALNGSISTGYSFPLMDKKCWPE